MATAGGYNIAFHICDQWAEREGQKLALVNVEDEKGVKYTFKDIKEMSDRLGNVLLGLGVKQGDRVALFLPQGVELAVSYLGILKIGAISVALTTMFGPEALRIRLADCGASTIITNRENEWKIQEIHGDLPDLQKVIVVGNDSRNKLDFCNLIKSASSKLNTILFNGHDPAIIAYTSGTTGVPKGVLHSHRNFPGRLTGFKMAHNYFPNKDSLFWTPADWTWIGGLFDSFFASWACGIPVLAYKTKKFDPEKALYVISRFGITNAFIPPAALRMLTQLDIKDDSYKGILKSVHSGGEVLPPELIEWGERVLGLTIHELYGLTECSLLVGNCKMEYPVRPGSMGKPFPGRLVEVMDEKGDILSSGTGQLVIRCDDPCMFLEYWNKLEITKEQFKGDWLLSGDEVEKDSDGYLWFKSRMDDLIMSAGYRIGPVEIENNLMKHPTVAKAGVVAAPHQERGQIVKAFVQLVEGETASLKLKKELQEFIKHKVAAYAYPREIEFIEEIPLTITGKINRKELRLREARKV
jgi:acetyl-CoA synthetase